MKLFTTETTMLTRQSCSPAESQAAIPVVEHRVCECGHAIAAFGAESSGERIELELLRVVRQGLRVWAHGCDNGDVRRSGFTSGLAQGLTASLGNDEDVSSLCTASTHKSPAPPNSEDNRARGKAICPVASWKFATEALSHGIRLTLASSVRPRQSGGARSSVLGCPINCKAPEAERLQRVTAPANGAGGYSDETDER